MKNIEKYLAEFIGTFFLMLIIYCAIVAELAAFIPLAIGLGLIGIIYSTGHISGADFNPVVSVSKWILGKLDSNLLFGYLIVQFAGGFAAMYCGKLMYGTPNFDLKTAEFAPAFCAEFLGTFALVFVILNVAISKGTKNNSFYGLAIGLIVVAMIYALGNVSQAAFNPTVAIVGIVGGLFPIGGIAYFMCGQIAGALAATFAFKIMEDRKD